MTKRTAFLLPAVLGALAVSVVALARGAHGNADPNGVIAHEWGTFTTVAGPQGRPVPWLPLSGPSDLPCFVERLKGSAFKVLVNDDGPLDYEAARKGLWGAVRMETPVIYFYAAQESTLNVRVTFPRGLMTEWYPRASVNQPLVHRTLLKDEALSSSIHWTNVRIQPSAQPALPREPGESHYYPARETDAAPLQVGRQFEKFLFYRGVGNFEVPISAVAAEDGTVHVTNRGPEPIQAVMVFENRNGKIGYHRVGTLHSEASIPAPQLTANVDDLRSHLVQALTAAGLFPREARAMVETWRDSWFEEGVRVFYLLPRPTVDRILPLAIDPSPRDVARAFVGRMEVITPATLAVVNGAIARRDAQILARYARFLGPIADRLAPTATGPEKATIDAITRETFTKYASTTRRCQ